MEGISICYLYGSCLVLVITRERVHWAVLSWTKVSMFSMDLLIQESHLMGDWGSHPACSIKGIPAIRIY